MEGYPIESFSKVEILDKQQRVKFPIGYAKVALLPWQHARWLALIGGAEFSEWKFTRKKSHIAETPNP